MLNATTDLTTAAEAWEQNFLDTITSYNESAKHALFYMSAERSLNGKERTQLSVSLSSLSLSLSLSLRSTRCFPCLSKAPRPARTRGDTNAYAHTHTYTRRCTGLEGQCGRVFERNFVCADDSLCLFSLGSTGFPAVRHTHIHIKRERGERERKREKKREIAILCVCLCMFMMCVCVCMCVC